MEALLVAPRTPAGDRRLTAMLRHDSGLYSGRSTLDAALVRGELLASFQGRALTPPVLEAIREELRTSFSPVILSGAARALRGSKAIDEEMIRLLEAASARIAARDEYVRFGADGSEGSPVQGPEPAALTARQEIAATIAAWAAEAPVQCCSGMLPARSLQTISAQPEQLCAHALGKVAMEDQDGGRQALVPLLRERASLLAFFYTRCMNPAKCSLTITRLAAFARFCDAGPRSGLNVLALTYDNAHDRPDRLFAYGRDRAFPFGEGARMLRCRLGWSALKAQLALRVGYGEATINDHARELFLVFPDLRAMALDVEALGDCPALMAWISERMPTHLK